MMAIFPFKPNWQAGIKESFEWLTEVQTAFDGSEHRRQLREFPRRFIEASFTLHGQDKQVFENFIAAYQAQAFYIPIWQEQSLLTALANSGAGTLSLDTTNRTFQAGKDALLYASITDLELVTISGKTDTSLTISPVLVGNWPNKTLVYPCYLVRFDDTVKNALRSSKVGEVTLRFLLEDNQQGVLAVAYTDDVLTVRNNWARDVGSEYNRQLESLDFGVYGRFIDDESGKPIIFLDYHFLLQTIADRYAFIQHLYDLSGKWKAIWIPSGQHDLTLAGNFTSGDSSIIVSYAGLSDYGITAPKSTLKITLKNNTVFYRAISNPVNNGNDTETLTINPVINQNFTPADVLLISYIIPMRLSADMVTLEHISSSVCACSVMFQSVNDTDIALPVINSFTSDIQNNFVPIQDYVYMVWSRQSFSSNTGASVFAWFDDTNTIVTDVTPLAAGIGSSAWPNFMVNGDTYTPPFGYEFSINTGFAQFTKAEFTEKVFSLIKYARQDSGATAWADTIRFYTSNSIYTTAPDCTAGTLLTTIDLTTEWTTSPTIGVVYEYPFTVAITVNFTFNLMDYLTITPPATVQLDSIKFAGTVNRGDSLTVIGEGVWSCDNLGNISFVAEDGFITEPSPIQITLLDDLGNESNAATITINYV